MNTHISHCSGLTTDERSAINDWGWFASLPPAARHDLIRLSRVRRFQPWDVISHRGTKSREWLGCARGAVRIASSSRSGKEVVLTYVQPGVWFAGPGLFDGRPSTHEALAHGETTILSVEGDDFASLLAGSPELSLAVLRLQARHIRELHEALEDHRTMPLRPRLAKRLAALARRHGEPDGDSGEIRIRLQLAQTELAQLVGSSRQRLNLELKLLERHGLIRQDREGLVVCNPSALAAA